MKLSRRDWVAAGALWAVTVMVFGAGASRLGFYYDDGGTLVTLPFISLHELWGLIQASIRGRNLQVFWQYLFYKTVGNAPAHLTALHLVQSGLDGLTTAGFFLLLRLLRVPAPAALIAAGWFSFWPTHGETHYWLTSASANLISTLLVFVFAATSVALTEDPRRRRLWPLDAAAFIGALFAYDQAVLALWVIAAVRVGVVVLRRPADRLAVAIAHIPHVAATALFLWLRMNIDPDSLVIWRADTLRMLRWNVVATLSSTMGRLWYLHVAPIYAKTTVADWVLACLAAGVITCLAIWLLVIKDHSVRPSGQQPSLSWRIVFSLAALFYFAAYLPIWVWYISPRHHFLPSAGLFAGAAVALAWVLERLRTKAFRVILVLAVGAAITGTAATGRGESRFWEESFTARKQLFAELKPDLESTDVLVLKDFPPSLGPAFFMTPHDVKFGPRLLLGPSSVRPEFTGSIAGAPAPEGIFLQNHSFYGVNNFRYYATERFLIVHFISWEKSRIRYEKNPRRSLPYNIISSESRPQNGSFGVQHASARRDAEGLIVSLHFSANLRPRSYVTAVFSYYQQGGFHRWGRWDRSYGFEVFPVLLSDPGLHPRSGGREWRETLRLYEFPQTDRLQLEFFEATRDDPPVRLGRAEAAVES